MIDDLRHLDKMFYLVYIDFADAFESVKHDFIFSTLVEFNIPTVLCCLIEDLHRYSSFAVLCGFRLSKSFSILTWNKDRRSFERSLVHVSCRQSM